MKLFKFLFSWSVLYGLCLVGLFFVQRSLIYFPDTKTPDISGAARVMPFTVSATDSNFPIHGWWSEPSSETSPVIVFFHGNDGNIGDRKGRLNIWASLGYGVLMAEYRGYGGNMGAPTEKGLYRDARAYINALTATRDISPDRIILYGETLGASVALQMAVEMDVMAVILEAPFYSLLDVVKTWFPFILETEKLLSDQYRSDLIINQVNEPILVAIPVGDFILPSESSQKLIDAYTGQKTVKRYLNSSQKSLYKHNLSEDMQRFIAPLYKRATPNVISR